MSPIADPWFYACAVPAVLLLGVSKSGFGAGFGALAVPLMALSVPVPQAAAILLPVLALMDALGLAAYWKVCDRRLLAWMVPFGLLGIVLGAFSFAHLSVNQVAGIVGLSTLAFLALRLSGSALARRALPPSWGGPLAVTSGFTSFVAHAGGPPINAYLLPLGLPPVVFTATLSVFFAVVNAAKWLPYAALGLLDGRNLGTSLALLPLAPLGIWAGVRIVRRIDAVLFYRLIHLGMALTGLKLVADAWLR